MKDFSFTATVATTKSLFVDLTMPTGTVTGRLYMTPTGGSEALVSGGVPSVASNGVNLSIPGASITTGNFPATFRLQLSNDSGSTWNDYATGRGVLDTSAGYSAGETEIKNDSGSAISITGPVTISNTPAVTVSGTPNVAVTNTPAVTVSGTPTVLAYGNDGTTNRIILTDSSGKVTFGNTNSSNSTGSWTTVGNSTSMTVGAYTAFTFYLQGTFAGVNATFEQSPDNVNWYQVMASNLGTNVVSTTTGVIGTPQAYEIATAGAVAVRARLTAITSGTVNVIIQGTTAPIDPAPAIGTHAVTQSGTWTVNATNTPVSPSTFSVATAASTNATSVKATAGSLFEISVSNVTATAIYVKLYNKTSAPTVGTDIPTVTLQIPANTTQVFEFGSVGKRFSAGIAWAATGAVAATDTSVAVAGAQIHFSYI